MTLYSYKAAERVSDRLNEMNKDLTSMIEEINGASAAINKTNKPDDPVSFVMWELHIKRTNENSSPKSSASSTVTSRNFKQSIRAPMLCRSRWRLLRRRIND